MKNPELIFSIRYYNPDWIQLGCAKGRIVSPLVQRFLCLCENMMSQGSQREVWQGVILIICARTLENLSRLLLNLPIGRERCVFYIHVMRACS